MYYNVELKHPVSGLLPLLVRDSAPPGGNWIALNGKGAHRLVGEYPDFFSNKIEEIITSDNTVTLILAEGVTIESRKP